MQLNLSEAVGREARRSGCILTNQSLSYSMFQAAGSVGRAQGLDCWEGLIGAL